MDPSHSAEVQLLAQRQAALCKVFSSHQRVLILWFLAEKERTVTERHNIFYRLAENDLLKNCLVLANMPKKKVIEV
jgi:hypothetical protein